MPCWYSHQYADMGISLPVDLEYLPSCVSNIFSGTIFLLFWIPISVEKAILGNKSILRPSTLVLLQHFLDDVGTIRRIVVSK